jgi:undecaprenyl-diphosphatase
MLTHLIDVDVLARAWIVAHRVGALNGAMWLVSAVGRGGLIFVLIAGAFAVRRRQPWDAVAVAAAVLLASILADHVLKPAVHRDRPFLAKADVAVIGGAPRDSSFPSGHAATAFAGASTLSMVAPRAALAWWAAALAVAYSRVYLGVHYPGDVLAGALLGIVSGVTVRMVVQRVRR